MLNKYLLKKQKSQVAGAAALAVERRATSLAAAGQAAENAATAKLRDARVETDFAAAVEEERKRRAAEPSDGHHLIVGPRSLPPPPFVGERDRELISVLLRSVEEEAAATGPGCAVGAEGLSRMAEEQVQRARTEQLKKLLNAAAARARAEREAKEDAVEEERARASAADKEQASAAQSAATGAAAAAAAAAHRQAAEEAAKIAWARLFDLRGGCFTQPLCGKGRPQRGGGGAPAAAVLVADALTCEVAMAISMV